MSQVGKVLSGAPALLELSALFRPDLGHPKPVASNRSCLLGCVLCSGLPVSGRITRYRKLVFWMARSGLLAINAAVFTKRSARINQRWATLEE